jgi:uncharacterized protein VirK/YbjX
LPDDLKEKIRSQLDHHLEKIAPMVTEEERRWIANLYNEIKFYLNSTLSPVEIVEIQKKFKADTIKLDAIRKEDVRVAVPELAEWFDKI